MDTQPEQPVPFWRAFAERWVKHRHTDNAASLSFYALLSLVPMLLLGVTIAGLILGEKVAHGELDKQLVAVVGADAANFLESILRSASFSPTVNPRSFLIALVAMLYSGSHVLSKLRESLNLVNEAKPGDPSRRWLRRLLTRAWCALLIVFFGVLLVFGTLVEGFVGYFADELDALMLNRFDLMQGYRLISTYLFLTVAFAMLLKLLPRRRPIWRHAFVGALFGAIAVGSLKSGLDLYTRHGLLASLYGTGLTVLIFFFWLFLSFQSFLAGAEIAAMLGRRRTRRRVVDEEVTQASS